MRWIKNTFITAVLSSSTLCFALTPEASSTTQATAEIPTTAAKNPPPYGDNPNIFKVLAHKTQEKVQHTAEKVEDATETGIAKIKPKVSQAWDAVTGGEAQNVPIEQKPLNQSSNNTAVPKPNHAAPTTLVKPQITPEFSTTPEAEAKPSANATSEAAPAVPATPTTPATRPATQQKATETTPNTVFFL